ncbi:MoeA, N-terminal and linker domain-containing protein [Gorgonomyces haynaldii]|nr:MoeA, N-terminal and linker domain-containing protein [Gorgonomyces haynaldii]
MFTVAIICVSDSSFNKTRADESTGTIEQVLNGYTIKRRAVVADDVYMIRNQVLASLDCDLILTTGGTGFGIRDQTPEAIEPLLEKKSVGLPILMMQKGLEKTVFAALSRPVAGVIQKSLVLTLPGSPKGCRENLEAVLPVLQHTLKLITDAQDANVHPHVCRHDQVKERNGMLSNELTDVTKRHRQSPYAMIEFDDALERVLKHCETLEPIRMRVQDLKPGLVIAQDVYGLEAVPGYRASVVDGYAVYSQDGPGVYTVANVATAGAAEETMLKPGTVCRIATGGPVPEGADAIVMVEDTELVEERDGQEIQVSVKVSVQKGQDIREIGSDLPLGSLVIQSGTRISSHGSDIGLLVSAGIKHVLVYPLPVVGLLSTGMEVVDIDQQLQYGAIRDANRPSLKMLLEHRGYTVVDLGIAPDDADKLEDTVRHGLDQCQVLITTGGVSMGEKDLLKSVYERRLGAQIHFGRVALKPGKPTTFATFGKKLIFGLAGNPVSALVTCRLFCLPALSKMSGKLQMAPRIKAKTTVRIKLDPRPEFQRGFLDFAQMKVTPTGSQQSSRLQSMLCNCLMVLPKRTVDHLEIGSDVECILLD